MAKQNPLFFAHPACPDYLFLRRAFSGAGGGAGEARMGAEAAEGSRPRAHAILIDTTAGTFCRKVADQLTFPASLAQLMTVEVCLPMRSRQAISSRR